MQARSSADNYYILEISLLRSGQPAAAATALRESLTRRPKHANTAFHLALALSRADQPEPARRILGSLLESPSKFGMRPAAEKLMATLPPQ